LSAIVYVDQKYQLYLKAECRAAMGWKALATNFAGAVESVVCGMCLTAEGMVCVVRFNHCILLHGVSQYYKSELTNAFINRLNYFYLFMSELSSYVMSHRRIVLTFNGYLNDFTNSRIAFEEFIQLQQVYMCIILFYQGAVSCFINAVDKNIIAGG
jgi:hypothetical protein